jgi:hypothetical protein
MSAGETKQLGARGECCVTSRWETPNTVVLCEHQAAEDGRFRDPLLVRNLACAQLPVDAAESVDNVAAFPNGVRESDSKAAID